MRVVRVYSYGRIDECIHAENKKYYKGCGVLTLYKAKINQRGYDAGHKRDGKNDPPGFGKVTHVAPLLEGGGVAGRPVAERPRRVAGELTNVVCHQGSGTGSRAGRGG